MRPLPRGTVSEAYALSFAFVLGAGSMLILALLVNALTAILTFFSIIGYAIVYTVWLKRATPQNIVIGGAAGAAPPVLGWTAVTGGVERGRAPAVPHHLRVDAAALLGARDRAARRVRARRHSDAAGHARRRLHQAVHLVLHGAAHRRDGAAVPDRDGGLVLPRRSARARRDYSYDRHGTLRKSDRADMPMRVFRFSINYLALLFAALLVDHYLPRSFN